jgi:hypothetical protein
VAQPGSASSQQAGAGPGLQTARPRRAGLDYS